MPYDVRWLIRRDMPQVLQIESLLNESAPWTEEDFMSSLREKNCIGLAAEDGDRIDGFALYELHKTTLNVIRFEAVEYDAAAAMFRKIEFKLSHERRNRVVFHIRERDTATLVMFREFGAYAAGLNREFFSELEDGIEMVYQLPCLEGAMS